MDVVKDASSEGVLSEMIREWLVAGGFCLVLGLFFLIIRSFSDTIFYEFMYGSGAILLGLSVLVLFIGLVYPSRKT